MNTINSINSDNIKNNSGSSRYARKEKEGKKKNSNSNSSSNSNSNSNSSNSNSNSSGKIDYKLENIIKKEKKLAATRKDILKLDSSKALNTILNSDMPATLIQSFPEQDFYFLMYQIGLDDFVPILSMASFEQWEYILDMEVWNNDMIDIPQMTRSLELLFKADPKRLMRWLINEKPEFIEYYFFKNIQVRIREHDEDPSDFEDGYRTIDDVFYVKFPEIPDTLPDYLSEHIDIAELKKNRQASEELITAMLNTVADMDLSVYHSLLLESCSIISAETEENQLRWKNIRLSEKGFYPYYEAVGIYQPVDHPDRLRRKPTKYIKAPVYGTDLPAPPQYPAGLLSHDSLFAQSFALIEENILLNLENEFSALVNRLISADKKSIHEKNDLEQMIKKACSYLDLGIGLIHGRKTQCLPGHGAAIIKKYWLEDIFRIASAAGIKLKAKAEKWYKKSFTKQNSLPLSFMGEQWFGLLGGLLLERPMYFDNYETGTLYREFSAPADIQQTSNKIDQLMAFDKIIEIICPEIEKNPPVYMNYQNILLTLWAKNRLGMDSSLSPIPMNEFKAFFKELFACEQNNENNLKDYENNNEKTDAGKKIDINKRKDLVLWLLEQPDINSKIKNKETFFKTIQPAFNALFDELENEYGHVKPDDLDPELISHFIV